MHALSKSLLSLSKPPEDTERFSLCRFSPPSPAMNRAQPPPAPAAAAGRAPPGVPPGGRPAPAIPNRPGGGMPPVPSGRPGGALPPPLIPS